MERYTALWALLLSCVILCATAPTAIAQEPIRVEIKEVLVPVFVIDNGRYQDLRSDPANFFKAISAGDTQLAESIMETIVIRGLIASDFRLFEDGQLHAVDNVSYQRTRTRDIRDNHGFHSEYIGPGGGKWSSREWPDDVVYDVPPPHYLVAYTPPESPEGSCHKIKIEVNRRNALVVARGEYCNSKHLASDPLNGTPFGKQMENDLASEIDSNVGITLTAVPLYNDGNTSRVHIVLDWPWKSLKSDSRTLGVMGMAFTKDGALNQRFSDIADVDSEGVEGHKRMFGNNLSNVAPTRYETQLILPPGEYHLRVALSDGKRFGRSEIPLNIESYDGKALAISAVSLCKEIQNVSDQSAHSPQRNCLLIWPTNYHETTFLL
jgi:hypothetical protein